jgi:diaminopimelate decarboxylase
MTPFAPVEPFVYRNGRLYCEDVALAEIASAVGTPVYVYSRAELTRRALAFRPSAPDGHGLLVCYALKANGNPTLVRLLGELGLGADITSGGELFLARHAGIPADKMIFSGVGKTRGEIAEALAAGIRALHVESEMELAAVAERAVHCGQIASIGVRVNPNINAETHPYISTGLHAHKFGVPRARALAILREAALHPWLRPAGLAAHIGSQITTLQPFSESVDFLIHLAGELAAEGIQLQYIDVGGGLGIPYESNQAVPAIHEWIAAVAGPVWQAGLDVVIEPGRSIVGPASALLSSVVYRKDQGEKQFIITDAGMSDLLRPALYNAYHPILPANESDGPSVLVDVVGPICETSDWLARERPLPPFQPGDLLAILQAGAYGFAMSSNYNGHLRAAEVLVENDSFRLIRQRQRYEDLLNNCL